MRALLSALRVARSMHYKALESHGPARRSSADVLWRLKGNPLKLVLLIGCQVVLVAVLAHDVVVESIAAKRGLVVAFGGPLAPIPSDVTIPAL